VLNKKYVTDTCK